MTANSDKKLILLVDDAPANIRIAREILKDEYKTRVATNGPKALELVKVSPPPDLILLDVNMPEMASTRGTAPLPFNALKMKISGEYFGHSTTEPSRGTNRASWLS